MKTTRSLGITAALGLLLSVACIGHADSAEAHHPMVTITTTHGTIVLELFPEDAPKTVENFLKLTRQGFYNGIVFHRVIPGFMVQTGDPTGTGRGGPGYAFADEISPADRKSVV